MFNVSSQSIKLCNKVMRTSGHLHLQVFLYQTFSNVNFQSPIRGALQGCHKTSEIELLQKQTTDIGCFYHECQIILIIMIIIIIICIFPTLSKNYERCMYDQMYKYFDQILSKYQCGFCRGDNTQHLLLVTVEKQKETLDKGGALLTDLSKAFDCIQHDPLKAKLAAYGLDSYLLSLFSVILMRENKEQKHVIPTTPTLIQHVEFCNG